MTKDIGQMTESVSPDEKKHSLYDQIDGPDSMQGIARASHRCVRCQLQSQFGTDRAAPVADNSRLVARWRMLGSDCAMCQPQMAPDSPQNADARMAQMSIKP